MACQDASWATIPHGYQAIIPQGYQDKRKFDYNNLFRRGARHSQKSVSECPAEFEQTRVPKTGVPVLSKVLAKAWYRNRPETANHRERKMRTNFFCTDFLNTPRGPGHPGKIPGTSQIPLFESQGAQTFEGWHKLFGHHPFAWKTPTPPGGLGTQMVNLCALFSCLKLPKKNLNWDPEVCLYSQPALQTGKNKAAGQHTATHKRAHQPSQFLQKQAQDH